MRPPVTIKFDFTLPLDIAHINLETQLGERRSNGFRVFTLINETFKDKNFFTEASLVSNTSSHSNLMKESSEEFNLGNWFSLKARKIVLKNYSYKQWFPLPPPICENEKNDSVFIGALRNKNKKALNCVKSLIIKVTSVCPNGPPVLKAIQVWGQPSSSSSSIERKKIIHLWHKRNERLSLAQTISTPPKLFLKPKENHTKDLQIDTSSGQ